MLEKLRSWVSFLTREALGLDRSPGDSYRGETAQQYVGTRPDWVEEQQVVEEILDSLPNGLSCLDIPVGPGRFLKKYQEKNYSVTGLDLSSDMLEIASSSGSGGSAASLELAVADVTSIPFPDKYFDICVSTRFLDGNITFGQLRVALTELRRVTRSRAIFHLSYRTRQHSVPLRQNRVIAGRLIEEELLELLESFGFVLISSRVTVARATSEAVVYLLEVRG